MLDEGRKGGRKLTQALVNEMRDYYGKGATQGALCRHFGVSIGQVGRIVRGESWSKTADTREATQAEHDGAIRRLLALQERVDAQREAEASGDVLPPRATGSIMPAPYNPYASGEKKLPWEGDPEAFVEEASPKESRL